MPKVICPPTRRCQYLQHFGFLCQQMLEDCSAAGEVVFKVDWHCLNRQQTEMRCYHTELWIKKTIKIHNSKVRLASHTRPLIITVGVCFSRREYRCATLHQL